MVRAGHDLRLHIASGQPGRDRLHGGDVAVLVAVPDDQQHREPGRTVRGQWRLAYQRPQRLRGRRDQRERGDRIAAHRRGHRGAEGVAGETHAGGVDLRERPHVRERRADVVPLPLTVVVPAVTAAYAAEVEAQHGDAPLDERLRHGDDDVVVHVAAVLRVRVADDDGRERAAPVGRGQRALQRDAVARDHDAALLHDASPAWTLRPGEGSGHQASRAAPPRDATTADRVVRGLPALAELGEQANAVRSVGGGGRPRRRTSARTGSGSRPRARPWPTG